MSFDSDGQKSVTLFKKELFAQLACAASFSTLVKSGCSEEELLILLFAASTVAVKNRNELLYDGSLSTKELTRLSKDLISVAGVVKSVNESALNPKYDLLWAPPDADRDELRKMAARFYDMLPGIMQSYSVQVERFSKLSKRNLRHMTFAHYRALKLLRYIRESTGGPQYDAIVTLLTGGFFAAGGTEKEIPKFFSVDALAQLVRRTAKLR